MRTTDPPAEVVAPGGNPADKGATTTNSNPQPSLIIFTRGYYSALAVTAWQPSAALEPPKDPQNLTVAEKIARYEQWREFAANAGTYGIKGSMLTRHPILAKGVEEISTGTAFSDEFKPFDFLYQN